MSMKSLMICSLLGVTIGFLSNVSSGSEAVTYFSKPPTPEQLSEALKPSAPAHKSAFKGRGIEWGDNANAAAAPATSPGSDSRGEAPATEAGAGVAMPVNFDAGSSQINDKSMPFVEAIGLAMQREPNLRLTVEGHTDSSGDPRKNVMLSWDRAMTVFRVLVNKYQIDPDRLLPEGKGMKEPLPGKEPSDAVNRRVQFRPVD